ncbi:helix-turn-helix transcriptional regulator [Peptostreptococcus sp.]|uniref:helix-turn-helix transcriptional regulator n=1 Tax=Peptostreptococcus sp. TaxID=1262 RepID=UPI001E13CDF3|nr:helix-turn-helix transcriptional regulator [Peptostreptococcus sp.]MBS5595695.1 helix-turn-helix transcriptional regulator [Peptostreptococcus sp.]
MTLRAARTNKELNQQEAAKKLGVSKDTIGNWEKGKTYPDVQQLKKIEELYDIEYKDIIFF